MMVSMETYLRRRQRQLDQLLQKPEVRQISRLLSCCLGGFFLSGGKLLEVPQPFAMGLCCTLGGWGSLAAGMGSLAGYRLFWGVLGDPALIWTVAGTLLGVLLGGRSVVQGVPLLLPMLSAFVVAGTGLAFQMLRWSNPSFLAYALQVGVAGGAVWLFDVGLHRGSGPGKWLCDGLMVLALGCMGRDSVWNLGAVVCGWFVAAKPFPATLLAGMGLDLARATPLPMTAVVGTACFLRHLPVREQRLHSLAVGVSCLLWMALWGVWDGKPLPGLVLGSLLGTWLAPEGERLLRPGHTGKVQVKLEIMAQTLAHTQQMLLEVPLRPVDEGVMLQKVRLHACALCPVQEACREQTRLREHHLHYPVEFTCRKASRIQQELRRAREHLLILRRERKRQQEYRFALLQQYRFLSEYIQALSDGLGQQEPSFRPRYRLRVAARSRGKEFSNGDSCGAFPGKAGVVYVALCDGMGTGLGAARESQTALSLLKQMLTADFPAPYALRWLNSLLVLRGLGGAVTLDLAEIHLDSGKTVLYKWGACPSYWIHRQSLQRIGSCNLPPGVNMENSEESAQRLNLSRGDTLIMLSDGAEGVVTPEMMHQDLEPAALAEQLLKSVGKHAGDDATVVAIRLLAVGE